MQTTGTQPAPTTPTAAATPASATPAAVAATPIAFVQAIAQAYSLRGMSPRHALAQAHIAPALLGNPQACISALQMELVSEAAMRELDDEALGWFSRRLPWGSYGMLVRASLTAPTLGLALQRWCRHHQLLTDDLGLQVQRSGEVAHIALTERRNLGTLREFCLVSMLRNVLGVASWLVDSRIALLGASFPFAPPPHHRAYAVLFAGPTAFDAPQARISLDARYLDLPLRRDEAALQHMLQHALPLTVLHYRRDRLLVQRVRQTLAAHPQLTHNADDLAALLAVSVRTLHRQLKEEGASLQALKDGVRRDHAVALLQRTTRPIKQVADAVGFQNEKSFTRAFKGWTGQTPGEYRASN